MNSQISNLKSQIIILCALCALCARIPSSHSADTIPALTWNVELSDPAKYKIKLYHGERIDLQPTYLLNNTPITLSNTTAVALHYRSSDMTNGLYYAITGSVYNATNGTITIPWTSDNEGTNSLYTFNIILTTTSGINPRCWGTISIADTVDGTVTGLVPWVETDYVKQIINGGTSGSTGTITRDGSDVTLTFPAGAADPTITNQVAAELRIVETQKVNLTDYNTNNTSIWSTQSTQSNSIETANANATNAQALCGIMATSKVDVTVFDGTTNTLQGNINGKVSTNDVSTTNARPASADAEYIRRDGSIPWTGIDNHDGKSISNVSQVVGTKLFAGVMDDKMAGNASHSLRSIPIVLFNFDYGPPYDDWKDEGNAFSPAIIVNENGDLATQFGIINGSNRRYTYPVWNHCYIATNGPFAGQWMRCEDRAWNFVMEDGYLYNITASNAATVGGVPLAGLVQTNLFANTTNALQIQITNCVDKNTFYTNDANIRSLISGGGMPVASYDPAGGARQVAFSNDLAVVTTNAEAARVIATNALQIAQSAGSGGGVTFTNAIGGPVTYPTQGTRYRMHRVPVDTTIISGSVLVAGGTSVSGNWQIYEPSGNGTPTNILNSTILCNVNLLTNTTNFAVSTIPAGCWLGWTNTAITGVVTRLMPTLVTKQ
jgi:hypothetical protein